MTDHKLELIDGMHTCSVCGWKWKKPPESYCPGLPRYDRKNWPEHLMTKKQLDAAGYQTGKLLPAPVACVYRQSVAEWLYLYDFAQATRKKQVTEQQKSALEKAKAVKASTKDDLQKRAAELWHEDYLIAEV